MDLTIVIPTFNRPRSLERLLRFLKRSEFEGRFLVLDSSDNHLKEQNQNFVESFDALAYFEYANDIEPFHKFADGIARVETKYAMLLGDDDLVFPDALAEILAFLEKNKAYHAAHGWYLNFIAKGKKIYISGIAYDSPSINDEEPLQRLRDLFGNYQALTYAVYRTDTAVDAFRAAVEMDAPLWQELAESAVTALLGPVARLPVISHARQSDSTVGYKKWHPVEWLATDPTEFLSDYRSFLVLLEQVLQRKDVKTQKHVPASSDPSPCSEPRSELEFIGLLYLSPFIRQEWIDEVLALSADATEQDRVAVALKNWSKINTNYSNTPFSEYIIQSRKARSLIARMYSAFFANHRARVVAHGRQPVKFEFSPRVLWALRGAGGKRSLDRVMEQFESYLST